MTDTTGSNAPKNAGPKPRLSLLSSKQSTRLRSEDYPADHEDLQTPLSDESVAGSNGFMHNKEIIGEQSSNSNSITPVKQNMSSKVTLNQQNSNSTEDGQVSSLSGSSVEQHPGGLDKLSVSKEDLLGLLSMLKSENQSKDIALASIKLEQLKRLINPVEISRSSLAKTYIQLQDQLRAKDQLRASKVSKDSPQKGQADSTTSSASYELQGEKESWNLSTRQVNSSYPNEEDDQESIDILNALLELLDRHPLLALPRDSIYCLDYNCNELSTKNYLNLKIQHLENLIDQHRRFRYHIGERLKQSEQRFMDLTLKLEFERKLRLDKEKSAFRKSGKTALLKFIEDLKDELEKEKASKHAIVMTLLNELLDERERNENLSNRVIDLEKRLSDSDRTQQRTSPTTSQQQQPAGKPRVPAKPAQLLDRQRSQPSNNK